MIFTTVLVSCLFALLGVFQQASVDTFLSSFTPALSSTVAFMHAIGSAKRLVLDASPLDGDSFFGPRNAAPVPVFFNWDTSVPDHNFSTWADTASSSSVPLERLGQPRDHLRHRLYIDLLIMIGITVICMVAHIVLEVVARLFVDKPSNQVVHAKHLAARIECELLLSNNAQDQDQPNDQATTGTLSCDALGFIRSPTSTPEMKLFFAPVSTYVQPSLSASTYADCTCVFGIAHCQRAVFSQTDDVDDDGHDYDDYLREALNMPLDGAPPVVGWSQDEHAGARRPSRNELRSWCFPGAQADDPYLGTQDDVADPQPTWDLHQAFTGLEVEELSFDDDYAEEPFQDDPFLDEPLPAEPSVDTSLKDGSILDEPHPEEALLDDEPYHGPLLIRDHIWHDPFLDECFAASESVWDHLRTLRAHPSFYDEASQVVPNLAQLFQVLDLHDNLATSDGDYLDDPFLDPIPHGEG
ncbi:hypothetical protein BV20DRAFT_665054 [Pilatotrama ljubarskyi]|nr:hypothetical protein BV20DRAFT_665054 [Pilatotrama ljubarskyi]